MFDAIMGRLLNHFEDEIVVYSHQGYGFETSENFWSDDLDWETDGTTYKVLVEDAPSDDTLERDGFNNESDMAIWAEDRIAEEADKVEYYGSEWLVISVTDFRVHGDIKRTILGVRGMD